MLTVLATLLGGLGLLLLGISLMSDGLKLATGNALRDILALWANSRRRSLLSGFLITGIVQSSSTVTVATIGFANAGMLSLERAVWVIFGSNVGSTMTAWIVALIGFQVDTDALALPLVGLGALLRLTGGRSRRAPLGLALAGFGLLLLGIGILQGAFDALGTDFALPEVASFNVLAALLYLLAGFALTTALQSSSAALVLALGAAQGGLIPLNAAAALVIGANLGTISTALISVFGATATAKRVAVSHVIFNLVTAAAAILILNPLLWSVEWLRAAVNLAAGPAMTLAIFHSAFNLLGVLLMWPLSIILLDLLGSWFRAREEQESSPRYLDRNVLPLPYIAADAMALEVSRINGHAIRTVKSSLGGTKSPYNLQEHRIVRGLAAAVGNYAIALNSTQLTPFVSEVISNLMESTQQYVLAANIAEDIAHLKQSMPAGIDADISHAMENFTAVVGRHLDQQDLSQPAFAESESASYEAVEQAYRLLKLALLKNASNGRLGMDKMDALLEYANQVKRVCRQVYKATIRLLGVRESLQRDASGQVVAAATTDQHNIDKLRETQRKLAEAEPPAASGGTAQSTATKTDISPRV